MNEQQIAVARVYAQAILGLAERQGESERIREELDGVVRFLDDRPDVEAYLSDPFLGVESRRQALEDLLRGTASDLLVDSLQVLSGKGRLGLVRSIAATYRHEVEVLRGVVEARVTSATPLTDESREGVRGAVESHTGQRAKLVETLDPEILGGLVIQIGDTKIDRSVAGELRRVRERLMDRMSRDLHAGTSYVEDESR